MTLRRLSSSFRLLGPICRHLNRCQPLGLRSMSSSTSNTGLSLAYDGDIAVIKMEKDDNRLSRDFLHIFNDFLDQIEGNSAIKGLITTGQGKFYSNGLNIDWMTTLTSDEQVDFMKSFLHFTKRLLFFPVPTLAALNGHTFAGGAVMAFAQDLRVMNSEKGWICLNEVHLRKRVYGFLASLLREKLGSGININDALLFGRRYTAQEALEARLIHSEAPPSDLLENSFNVLRSYIGKDGFDSTTFRNMKQDIYADCLVAFEKQLLNLGFAEQFMTDSQHTTFRNSIMMQQDGN